MVKVNLKNKFAFLKKSKPINFDNAYGLENIDTWDADYIRKRSERLCSLAWDKIVKWLE